MKLIQSHHKSNGSPRSQFKSCFGGGWKFFMFKFESRPFLKQKHPPSTSTRRFFFPGVDTLGSRWKTPHQNESKLGRSTSCICGGIFSGGYYMTPTQTSCTFCKGKSLKITIHVYLLLWFFPKWDPCIIWGWVLPKRYPKNQKTIIGDLRELCRFGISAGFRVAAQVTDVVKISKWSMEARGSLTWTCESSCLPTAKTAERSGLSKTGKKEGGRNKNKKK